MNKKRVVIIIIASVAVIIVALIMASGRVRTFLLGPLSSKITVETTEPSPQITALSTVRVSSPTLVPDRGTIQYYEEGTGKMFEVQPDGTGLHVISSSKLPDFISSAWAPDGRSVITAFSSPEGFQFKAYRFDTKQSFALPAGTQSVAFSPDSTRIAYFQTSKDGSRIAIMPAGDGVAKNIFQTRLTSAALMWPSDEFLALMLQRSAGDQADILLITLSGSVTHLLDDQRNVEQMWARSGAAVLLSLINSDSKQELWVKDIATGLFTVLPVTTSASKCAWSLDLKTVWCAIAHQRSGQQYDDFVAIDLGTGTSRVVIDGRLLTPRVVAESLIMSPDETHYIVKNKTDGKLYSITSP